MACNVSIGSWPRKTTIFNACCISTTWYAHPPSCVLLVACSWGPTQPSTFATLATTTRGCNAGHLLVSHTVALHALFHACTIVSTRHRPYTALFTSAVCTHARSSHFALKFLHVFHAPRLARNVSTLQRTTAAISGSRPQGVIRPGMRVSSPKSI